jgi:hypothetical protein
VSGWAVVWLGDKATPRAKRKSNKRQFILELMCLTGFKETVIGCDRPPEDPGRRNKKSVLALPRQAIKKKRFKMYILKRFFNNLILSG